MRQKNWETAVNLLKNLDREALRQTYRDIETMYLEACQNAGIIPYPETPAPNAETSGSPATPAPSAGLPAPTPGTSPDPFLVTEDDKP